MFKNTIRLLATIKYRENTFSGLATYAQRSPFLASTRSFWRFSHKFVCFLCHWLTLRDFVYLENGARGESTLPLDEIEMPKATLYNALWLWFSLLLLHQYLFIIVSTIWRERSCVNSNNTIGEIPEKQKIATTKKMKRKWFRLLFYASYSHWFWELNTHTHLHMNGSNKRYTNAEIHETCSRCYQKNQDKLTKTQTA